MIAFNYLFEVLSYIKSEDIKLFEKLFWKTFLKNFCRLFILKDFQVFESNFLY
jgi:hypothetical protein